MNRVIEALRRTGQSIARRADGLNPSDEVYPRTPLSIRNFTNDVRWQEAERVSPLDQREFVRQEIMDLMGNVDERGGHSNHRYESVSVDQLRNSSLPAELVEFIVGGVEDPKLREKMAFYNYESTSIELRLDADFATYRRWTTTNIRLVLARTIPDGMVVPAHEFGIAVDATMPPFSVAERGPKAEIYDAALHLNRPGTSGTDLVDMVARHKDRFDALLAYKHDTSKVTIARELIRFGQSLTPPSK